MFHPCESVAKNSFFYRVGFQRFQIHEFQHGDVAGFQHHRTGVGVGVGFHSLGICLRHPWRFFSSRRHVLDGFAPFAVAFAAEDGAGLDGVQLAGFAIFHHVAAGGERAGMDRRGRAHRFLKFEGFVALWRRYFDAQFAGATLMMSGNGSKTSGIVFKMTSHGLRRCCRC